MISLPEELEVLVAAEFIDMRKQIDGLCLLVDDQFSRSPQSKAVLVKRLLMRQNTCLS